MKKLLFVLALGVFAVSCKSEKAEEVKADSVVAKVDSVVAKVDSTVAKVDSTVAKVDSVIKKK